MRHDAHGFWIADHPPVEPLPPLSGEISADVLIAGGGFTGLWAAWWIKAQAPDAEVVLVDSEVCGQGPSGRNGGFCNSMWFSLPTLRARFGDQPGLAVAEASAASIRAIGRFCEEQSVDAAYRRGGYMQTSAAPAQDDAWSEAVAACTELGVPDVVEVLDAEATRARCDSPAFRGAAYFPDGATVNPGALAMGLRHRVIEAGVRVFERTEITSSRSEGGGVRARTPSGTIRAGSVILATGVRLLRFPGLRRCLTATSSHMLITEPVPDVIEQIGWTGGECITDSRAMIHYFRTTRNGRIAFGWGGGPIVRGAKVTGRVEVDPGMARQVEAHLRRFFPQLEGRRIDHAWGGPVDVSPTHLPVVRTVGDRAFAGFGYTGNGVAPSQLVGRILASLALDRRDEMTGLALVDPPAANVPPEPFRWIGGAAIRRALLRKERLQEADRRVDPITNAVCGIPERVGIHIGR